MEKPPRKTPGDILWKVFLSLTVNLAFLIPGGIFLNDSVYYSPCSEKSSVYMWSYVAFVLIIISIVINSIVIPFLWLLVIKNVLGRARIWILYLIDLITFVLLIKDFVLFPGLSYAYSEKEGCGKLSHFVLALIIMYSIIFGFFILEMLCLLCLGKSKMKEVLWKTWIELVAHNYPEDEMRNNVEVANQRGYQHI